MFLKCLFCTLFCSFIFLNGIAQDCQLKVKVTGIKKIEGDLIIAVFDNENDYLEKPVKAITIKVQNGVNEACFNALPSGIYAISVIHDLDKNGKLNTRLYGPPAEPYGFYNNVKGTFGPPAFENTSFQLKKDESKSATIHLFD
ncbi:DUF2141 domain-containing protein [Hyphobacterium sp. CCMP332]|nr:DUF2141 domain-containing protein [Hyphobacterium sp. CCMP332]